MHLTFISGDKSVLAHRFLVGLAGLLLCAMAAPALAQAIDCKQFNDILAIANWRSLANGPFAKNANTLADIAPAKAIIKGLDTCRVVVFENAQLKTETQTYDCRAPAPSGQSRAAAALTVAASWRSCLAGWSEHSVAETLRFSNKDRAVHVIFAQISEGAPVVVQIEASKKPQGR